MLERRSSHSRVRNRIHTPEQRAYTQAVKSCQSKEELFGFAPEIEANWPQAATPLEEAGLEFLKGYALAAFFMSS